MGVSVTYAETVNGLASLRRRHRIVLAELLASEHVSVSRIAYRRFLIAERDQLAVRIRDLEQRGLFPLPAAVRP